MTEKDSDSGTKRTKRAYRGTVQAEVAALTRQRILDAALALAADEWLDRLTLDQIAARNLIAGLKGEPLPVQPYQGHEPPADYSGVR